MPLGRIKIVLVYYWSNIKAYSLTRGKLVHDNDGGKTPSNPLSGSSILITLNEESHVTPNHLGGVQGSVIKDHRFSQLAPLVAVYKSISVCF